MIDIVPVFPLPDVVLMPDQQLPLHIFEPRYRAMVRDALDGPGWILVVPIFGDDEEPMPAIPSVATAGRIVARQLLPDGRYNILVEGSVRVRLEELPFEAPYRRARVTPLAEPPDDTVPEVERTAMIGAAAAVMRVARELHPAFDYEIPKDLGAGRLALRLIDRFVPEATVRQRALEARTAAERVVLATEALADLWTAGEHPRPSGNA